MLIIWWSSHMTKQVKSLNNIIFLCKCLINLQGDRPSYIWTFKQFTTPPVPCAAVVVFVLPCHLPLLQDSPCFRLSWPNRGEGDHPKAQRREFLPCPLCPPCPAVGSCGNFCASFGTTLTTMRKFFGNHSPKTTRRTFFRACVFTIFLGHAWNGFIFFCGICNVFLGPCIVLVSEMLSFTMVTKCNHLLVWKLHRFLLYEVVSKASQGSLLRAWFCPFLDVSCVFSIKCFPKTSFSRMQRIH